VQSASGTSDVELLSQDQCSTADEIFLTNVIMQIMPVTEVEKHTVGDGKVGTMIKRLQKDFDEFVKEACKPKEK